MANAPHGVLQKLAEEALRLCRAHSCGVSLLDATQSHFRWCALAGTWAKYIGGTMPRGLSPCGDVLDRNRPLLLSRPELYYTIPPEFHPGILELLLIPFYVAGKAVGTIWVLAHDEAVHFDAEDERVMSVLGRFAASAYQNLATLEAARMGEARYRALVHSTADTVWRMSGDGLSMLELKSTVARPHPLHAGPMKEWLETYVAPEDRERLHEAWKHAVRTRSLYDVEHRALAANGEDCYWHSRAIPLLDAEGNVTEWIGASVDITAQKSKEHHAQRRLNELASAVASHTAELDHKEQKLKRAITRQMNAESAQMLAMQRLIDASEAEQRHISRELHDQVGQQLTSVGIGLSHLLRDAAPHQADQLSQLRSETEAVSRAVHDLARQLRPRALDDGGLSPALASLVEDWSLRTRITAELECENLLPRPPAPVETTLYRVAQEALQNIAKHAYASKVSVALATRGEEIILIVEDDGVGFDLDTILQSATPSRLGLMGMRERAGLCGGDLNVESMLGKGTTIYCRVPSPLST